MVSAVMTVRNIVTHNVPKHVIAKHVTVLLAANQDKLEQIVRLHVMQYVKQVPHVIKRQVHVKQRARILQNGAQHVHPHVMQIVQQIQMEIVTSTLEFVMDVLPVIGDLNVTKHVVIVEKQVVQKFPVHVQHVLLCGGERLMAYLRALNNVTQIV